jgi:hypothetical protein
MIRFLLALSACHRPDPDGAQGTDSGPACVVGWEATDIGIDNFVGVVTGDDGALAVGFTGRVVRIDDAQTLDAGSAELRLHRVVQGADGTIWALANDSGVWKWDGAWSEIPRGGVGNAYDLVARASGDVVVIGTDECSDCHEPTTHVATWDGAHWQMVDLPEDQYGYAAAETPDGRLVIVGGGGLVSVESGAGFEAVDSGTNEFLVSVAADESGIVAAGWNGVVVSGEIDELTVETIGADNPMQVDVAGSVAWVAAWEGLWVNPGTGWHWVATTGFPYAVTAAAADDVFVVTDGDVSLVLRGDANGLDEVYRKVGADGVQTTWTDEDGDTWMTDWDGRLLHWRGDTLELAGRADFYGEAMDGSGSDDIVFAEEGIAEWDGATLDTTELDDDFFFGVAVSDAGAWVVGLQRVAGTEDSVPLALQREADGWEALPTAIEGSRYLTAAWASDDGILFVLAELSGSTALLRWDGSAWTTLSGDLGDRYAGIEGRGPDDLYVYGAGDGGSGVLHWDGTMLVPVGDARRVIDLAITDTALFAMTFDPDTGSELVALEGTDPYGSFADVDYVRMSAGGGTVALVSEATVWQWNECE